MTDISWPELAGDVDKAEFCVRVLASGRRVTAFAERDRVVFVTGHPEVFSEILERGAGEYTAPSHPYRDAVDLYTPAGLALLRLAGDRRQPPLTATAVHRVVSEEIDRTTTVNRPQHAPVMLLDWCRAVFLRTIVRLLFGTTAEWSDRFVAAASFLEGWQVFVSRPAEHPALALFMAADELVHRSADEILRSCRPTRGVSHGTARTAVIETIMNGYNALAATFAWLLIDVWQQPTLWQELVRAIGTETAHSAPLSQQKWLLNHYVLEALRLHPTAWAIGRTTERQQTLAAHHVPPGALILCCTYALHRDSQRWREAGRFCPARFATFDRGNRAFAPFGLGPRACPARHFVPLILRTALESLLRKYEVVIHSTGDVRNRSWIGLVPHPDPRMDITPRTGAV